MALTEDQKAELAKLTPEQLVAKLAANHEILDRHDAKATAAEERAAAAEKKIADDAEAARLATLSEVEKAKAATEKATKAEADASAKVKLAEARAAVKVALIKAGAVDEADVLALLGPAVFEQDAAAVIASIAALKTKYPALFGAEQYREGEHPGTGAGSRGKGPVITQAELDKLQDKDPAAWRAARKRINAKELTLLP